ncbi:MAG TPA: hypothetical protein VMA77_25365 [Solirubrobacteraceae bacterium]|nr:hypothetical protein [Solirubrobacteraceae bacterium]
MWIHSSAAKLPPPLIAHSSIDLDVGAPVQPPKVIAWAGTSL